MERWIAYTVCACFLILFAVAAPHRIASLKGGEKLDRSKEGWPTMIGIRLFGIAGFAQIYLALRHSSRLDWANIQLPIALRWCGVGLLAASVAWLCWMFASLGRNLTDTVVTRRDSTLVESGPYRYVRNPMYTGLAWMGLALGLAFENIAVPLPFLTLFTLLAIRTRKEERYLIERFGDAYRDYMQRVGRFLPRV